MVIWSVDLTIRKDGEGEQDNHITIVPIKPQTPPSTKRVSITSKKDKAIND